MTAGTVPHDVKAYLDAVRARLDDLPPEERDDLLADVEPSILDSAGESDAPAELRLGSPESFADELRAAAGLPPRGKPVAARLRLGERLAAADAYLSASPRTRWLRELAPLWWVLRGLVLVGLLELLRGRSVFAGGRPTGYAWLVLATAIAAVIVSVAIGLRRPRRNTIIVLVNVVLAVAALPVTWHALNAARDAAYNNTAADLASSTISQLEPGLVYEDIPVENVYAFDRDGRLLQDVRLFDQFGRPLAVGGPGQDPNRREVRTRSGRTVFNAFPIRYFEPGTERVADPGAGVPARPARLATKPLASRR